MSERHQSKRQWNQILSDDDVREIRRLAEIGRELRRQANEYGSVNLGKRFGVHPKTIRNIVYSENRADVE